MKAMMKRSRSCHHSLPTNEIEWNERKRLDCSVCNLIYYSSMCVEE